MNRVITLLIISDMLVFTAFGLIEPIFSVYVKEGLIAGSLVAAGIASMIFLVSKSLFQLPIASYVDKHQNREFFLILGGFLIALTPLLYYYSSHVYQVYLIQILYGLGAAMEYPTWLSLFSSNVDKKKENFEWAFHSTGIGLAEAFAAVLGAFLAESIGFKVLFLIVAVLAACGTSILFFLGKIKKSTIYSYRHVLARDRHAKSDLL